MCSRYLTAGVSGNGFLDPSNGNGNGSAYSRTGIRIQIVFLFWERDQKLNSQFLGKGIPRCFSQELPKKISWLQNIPLVISLLSRRRPSCSRHRPSRLRFLLFLGNSRPREQEAGIPGNVWERELPLTPGVWTALYHLSFHPLLSAISTRLPSNVANHNDMPWVVVEPRYQTFLILFNILLNFLTEAIVSSETR